MTITHNYTKNPYTQGALLYSELDQFIYRLLKVIVENEPTNTEHQSIIKKAYVTFHKDYLAQLRTLKAQDKDLLVSFQYNGNHPKNTVTEFETTGNRLRVQEWRVFTLYFTMLSSDADKTNYSRHLLNNITDTMISNICRNMNNGNAVNITLSNNRQYSYIPTQSQPSEPVIVPVFESNIPNHITSTLDVAMFIYQSN